MLVEAFSLSTLVVAVSEIGDKTQLLALLLAARFRKPAPIIAGILAATLLNHAIAGGAGAAAAALLNPEVLRWILAASFLLMGLWMLVPDKADDDGIGEQKRRGAFVTTLILFFLAEMGDKTQLATVALAAHYQSALTVVAGTTVGMLIADVPAVFAGEWIMKRVSLKIMRRVACALFVGLAALALFAPESAEPLTEFEGGAASFFSGNASEAPAAPSGEVDAAKPHAAP